ncbi:CvpA family protein [Psychrobacter pygoscelis]|uniref:CvpA family protein n=1 Tax=Psychrobacter pygoscelis TaxID=2488563 RepID=UPI0010398DBA|nr:CvpA family protein [Psychrobacter pygoscelis]
MSGLDIAIAVIVLMGLWRGFQAGLVKSVLGLVGWFIALVAATRLADSVAPQMAGLVQSPVLQMALAFLAVVLVVIVIMHLLAFVFSSAIRALHLSLVDKLAGAVIGTGKHVLIVLVMLSMAAPILVQTPVWQRSVLAPELMPFAPMAKTLTYEVMGVAWDQVNTPK